MSWKIALVVALLSGIVTAVVTTPVADKLTELHGMSDFEGKRGYALVFLFIPAGFIGGFLMGLLGTKLVGAMAWHQFWQAAGLSVLLGQVALWGIGGLSLLTIQRPPTFNGRPLALAMEILIPVDQLTATTRDPGAIRMSLYASDKDNQVVTVDPERFREENGLLVVPASALLFSRSTRRIVSVHLNDGWLAYDFDLPAVPTPTDAWSEPAAMRDAKTTGQRTERSTVKIRYRVLAMREPPA